MGWWADVSKTFKMTQTACKQGSVTNILVSEEKKYINTPQQCSAMKTQGVLNKLKKRKILLYWFFEMQV